MWPELIQQTERTGLCVIHLLASDSPVHQLLSSAAGISDLQVSALSSPLVPFLSLFTRAGAAVPGRRGTTGQFVGGHCAEGRGRGGRRDSVLSECASG